MTDTDIVTRLRSQAEERRNENRGDRVWIILDEAADEIQELRRRLDGWQRFGREPRSRPIEE